MKKIIVRILIVLILFLIQSSLPGVREFGLPKPDLLLSFIIAVAFLTDKINGAIHGFAVGLASDLISARAIGLNALLYMFAGLLSGMLNNRIYRENVLVPVITAMYLTAAAESIRYIVQVLTYGQISYIYALRTIIIPEVFMNCITTGILHTIISRSKIMGNAR